MRRSTLFSWRRVRSCAAAQPPLIIGESPSVIMVSIVFAEATWREPRMSYAASMLEPLLVEPLELSQNGCECNRLVATTLRYNAMK